MESLYQLSAHFETYPFVIYFLNIQLDKIEYHDNLIAFKKNLTEEKWVGSIENDQWIMRSIKTHKVPKNLSLFINKSHKTNSRKYEFPIHVVLYSTLEMYPGMMFHSKTVNKVIYSHHGERSREVFLSDDLYTKDKSTTPKELREMFENIDDWRITERKFQKAVDFEYANYMLEYYAPMGIGMKECEYGLVFESYIPSGPDITSASFLPIDMYFYNKQKFKRIKKELLCVAIQY